MNEEKIANYQKEIDRLQEQLIKLPAKDSPYYAAVKQFNDDINMRIDHAMVMMVELIDDNV